MIYFLISLVLVVIGLLIEVLAILKNHSIILQEFYKEFDSIDTKIEIVKNSQLDYISKPNDLTNRQY